jgi:nitrite reductase (NADH) large subunit
VRKKVLIAGFGMAAQRLLEDLAPWEPELDITVLSQEPVVAYDRIKLSTALAQGQATPDLSLRPAAWHLAHGYQLRLGESLASLDTEARRAATDKGAVLDYDELVLATGSNPLLPPIPGIELPGVHVFRRLSDCQALQSAAKPGLPAVVLGGGLLGLEAAKGLLNLGCQVTVVHLMDRLMERQLDARAAQVLRQDLEAQGLRFELGANTQRFLGSDKVEGLQLADGRTLDAALVVVAIGVRPETGVATAAGLEVKRGIVVDDHLRTSAPGVWALGECAEHRGIAYGLVAPLYEQAATLAKRLAGMENAPYLGSKVYTKLKVAGLEVFSCGDINAAVVGGRDLSLDDALLGRYKRALFEGKKLKGAVLYGDTAASQRLLKALDLDDAEAEVRAAFGLAGAGANNSPLAGMADADLVCNCNQVSLGTIKTAIKAQGCRSVAQVQACTAASSSCGSCKGLVEAVLAQATSAGSAPAVAAAPAVPAPVALAAKAGRLDMVGAHGGQP